MATRTLSAVDYTLLAILLLSSTAIGVLFGCFKSKNSSAREFLIANGDMGVLPTALSLSLSFLSAIALLGMPSAVYLFGTMYFYQGISVVIASIIIALVFMPKFREMNFISSYEYLERRFDRTLRTCVSMTFSSTMLLYMAIVLYAPALALSQTTGLSIWLCVVSSGVICTFYSSVGGMKAVMWTDALQSGVIFIGLLIAIVQGLIEVGGVKRTLSIAWQGNRIIYGRTSLDPRTPNTIWGFLIGVSFNAFASYSFNQMFVQRYMSARSTRAAQQALYLNAVSSVIIIFSSCFMGLIIYAYYATCDPLTSKQIESIDQIFPYFIMEVMEHRKGFLGVFLACIFSGSLSSISSGLNSLAAVLIEDFYKGLLGQSLTDQRQGFLSKMVSVALGALIMLLTYVVSHLGSILNACLSLFGVLEGPIAGVFMLGLLVPRANRRGGLIGFLVGLAFMLWIFVGAQIHKNEMVDVRLSLSVASCASNSTTERTTASWTTMSNIMSSPTRRHPLIELYSVNFIWYSPIAIFMVMLVGTAVSYLTGPLKPNEVDPKLIISMSDMFCCCLPDRWRRLPQYNADKVVYLAVKRNDESEQAMTTSDTPVAVHDSRLTQTVNLNSDASTEKHSYSCH